MTNASNFEGLLSLVLIFIASCVHINRVKALKPILSTEFKNYGPLSIFHKASVCCYQDTIFISYSTLFDSVLQHIGGWDSFEVANFNFMYSSCFLCTN